MNRVAIALIAVLLLSTTSTLAEVVSLSGRHQLGLKIGMWSQTNDTRTEIGLDGVETSVGNNGAFGGIFYSHWLQENLALTCFAGGMALDVSTDAGLLGVNTETSTVGTLLMGLKYYFAPSTLNSKTRPYLRAAVGPFIGSQSNVRSSLEVVQEERTEYAAGGQLGAGIDFVTGRHFMMGLELGYNLMSDFDRPIGGSSNYSGPEFGFDLAWLFGQGRN